MKTIKIKEFEVPIDIIAEVADLIASNDFKNSTIGTDEDKEIVLIEICYDKDEKDQRSTIHEIEDAISDHYKDDD